MPATTKRNEDTRGNYKEMLECTIGTWQVNGNGNIFSQTLPKGSFWHEPLKKFSFAKKYWPSLGLWVRVSWSYLELR